MTPAMVIADELDFSVFKDLALAGNLLIARAASANAVELYPDQAIDLWDSPASSIGTPAGAS
jgi:hypothetical protein